ncbi:hypothetical protein Godav_029103 [Gossypium davidsonii]|uniref:Uncharacterized protein n=1 Tax=Gossypium davidsonii TaxID=34287 RepID=A0A7J8TDR9_GOSDV|nr:hypothetical protein [Gossypium davidsonii]
MRRNGVELVMDKAKRNVEKDESQTNSRGGSEQIAHKGKEKGGEEGSISNSPLERKSHRAMRDGMGRFKSKRKRQRGSNGETKDESPTKIHTNAFSRIHSTCKMEGCLAVISDGKSGGLAVMWREGVRVTVQNYSNYHIDTLVDVNDGQMLRFTGFYGQSDPCFRQNAWDMLRRVKSRNNEKWIVGGL